MSVLPSNPRVAFVHDWLDTYRGGEKVLECLLELFPDAPIYTLFYDPTKLPQTILRRNVIFPKILKPFRRFRRLLLPILPHFVEYFDLREYDLIVSTSSCVAKGIIPSPTAKHICYIHSPMRYVWDQQNEYLQGRILGLPIVRALFQLLAVQLRLWDVVSSVRVDRFIANSKFVAHRIKRFYGRDSEVIHPPISDFYLKQTSPETERHHEYYLSVGAFVRYKRFDLAIEACKRLDRKLVIIGSGQQETALKKLAGPNVEFIDNPSDDTLLKHMRQAKALIFPGVEDFGMTGVEAIACGTPVIALRQGGSLDFVIENKNGVFFDQPSIESLTHAMKKFEGMQFQRKEVALTAQPFSKKEFQHRFIAELKKL